SPLIQVPPPLVGNDAAKELESARRSSLAREAVELNQLAEQLARHGELQAADRVRALIPRPAPPDGPIRLMPLPEVVERGSGATEALPKPVVAIRNRTAAELFELAQRAAKADSPQYALASICLREVVERQPDHKEVRRLLGYVPHRGGWARPFA